MINPVISGSYAGLSLVLYLGFGMAGVAVADPQTVIDPPLPTVTSDTLDYCIHLAQEITEASYAPEAARALSVEGQQLCSHGQVRGGIIRLRRAMLLMHSGLDRTGR